MKAVRAALLVTLLLLPAWYFFLSNHRARFEREQRKRVSDQASLYADSVRRTFQRAATDLSVLRGFVARQLEETGAVRPETFAVFAAGLRAESDAICAFQVVRDGVIQLTWPYSGNERVVGYDLRTSPIPQVADDYQRAMSADRVMVTGPVPLLQGIPGLVIRRRIAGPADAASAGRGDSETGRGFSVAAVMSLDALVSDAGLTVEPSGPLQTAIRERNGVPIFGAASVYERNPVFCQILLPEGQWELAAVPSGGWPSYVSESGFVVVLSGLIVLLLSGLAAALTWRDAALTVLVRERTAELSQVNERLVEDLRLRAEAERRLRENESHLQSIIEMEPACVKVVTEDGRVTDMNRAGLCMLDADGRDQVVGQSMERFVHPDSQAAVRAMLERVFRGQQADLEFRVVGVNGRELWVETRAVPMAGPDGRVTSMLAITRDVTETRAAQESLRQSELRFRSIFEQAAVGVLQHEADSGRILKINDRLCQILQQPRSRLLQRTIQDVFPDTTRADSPAGGSAESWNAPSLPHAARAVQQPGHAGVVETAALHECEISRPDGSTVWLRLTSSQPSHDPLEARSVTIVVEDVTQRRRDADLLLQRDAILQAVALAAAKLLTAKHPEQVIESVLRDLGRSTRVSRAAFFLRQPPNDTDRPGRPDWVNPVAEWCAPGIEPRIDDPVWEELDFSRPALTGWSDALRQGRPIQCSRPSCSAEEGALLDARGAERMLLLPVSLGTEWSGFLAFDKCGDDRPWSAAEIGALQIAAETLAAALKRREAEVNREELQEQLAQSQKLEAVGQLAGGVAHDFNNMLQVILGYCDVGASLIEDDDVFSGILQEIRTAARRSADLTQQLLTFARRQRVETTRLDLNRAIPDMLSLLRRLVGENIELKWQPGDRECPVKMDPSQLDQILANLIVNARDAIQDWGTISISTRPIASESADRSEPAMVALIVSDDGCGMRPEVQARIFEPFYTTKSVGEGSGLGLSTVYGVVQQNQGRLLVRSEPGIGTTMTVLLPAATDQPLHPQPLPGVGEMRHGSETVILVEDEPLVLDFGSQLLRTLGYRVAAYRTPGDALNDPDLPANDADLLITDVMMPGMHGGELARRLKARSPRLRSLFMSGFAPETLKRQLGEARRDEVLFKPFSAAELAVRVREVLDADPDETTGAGEPADAPSRIAY